MFTYGDYVHATVDGKIIPAIYCWKADNGMHTVSATVVHGSDSIKMYSASAVRK